VQRMGYQRITLERTRPGTTVYGTSNTVIANMAQCHRPDLSQGNATAMKAGDFNLLTIILLFDLTGWIFLFLRPMILLHSERCHRVSSREVHPSAKSLRIIGSPCRGQAQEHHRSVIVSLVAMTAIEWRA
jgi:hypothetical protein